MTTPPLLPATADPSQLGDSSDPFCADPSHYTIRTGPVVVRLAYIYINLHKPCLEAQGDTKVSLKSKGPSKPSGLSLHPVWSKPTGTTVEALWAGQTGAFSTGSPTQSPPPWNGDKDAYFTAVLRPLKALPDSFQALALSHPLRPFISTSWSSLLSARGPGLPYRPREVHRSPEESPLGSGATGPPASQQAVLPEFLNLAGSGLEAGGYQLWPFTKMPVDLVPCWFTAREQRMADMALTTPPKYHPL